MYNVAAIDFNQHLGYYCTVKYISDALSSQFSVLNCNEKNLFFGQNNRKIINANPYIYTNKSWQQILYVKREKGAATKK